MPIDSKVMEPGILVVSLSGRLVFGRDVERLEGLVKDALKQGRSRLVFDASTLDYVDSSGIGAIVSCLTEVKKAGGDLRLAGANARVQRLFSMTGVDKLLRTYSNVAEAAAG